MVRPSARGAREALRGRTRHCEALDEVLTTVQGGLGAVLVLRGEAGAGKTALLDHLTTRAARCRITDVAGMESEMELAFAGLHHLCRPFLNRLDRLPAPQHDALTTAFGLSAGPPPDRFLVGLATLSLLADVGTDLPLVCVVDDAQWLDEVSLQTLAFVARRLGADPVAMVFAVREPDLPHELRGLPELTVEGLAEADARALLDSAFPSRLDARVRDRIVAETGGNPLALLELPRALTTAELAGGFERPDTRPLAGQLEAGFLRIIRSLPAATRQLLVLAAAEPVGDPSVLGRAADRLGVSLDAAAPAEAAGLIEIGASVRFRHPLVRSAVYRAADARARRETHRALGAATGPETDPDRRAWHLAQAADGFDDAVADELERAADRARGRGGVTAAAAFLERATELTPPGGERVRRALAAAQEKLRAGAPDAARSLLETAAAGHPDDLQRAHGARVRAHLAYVSEGAGASLPLLLDAGRQLEHLDPPAARETYLEAVAAAMYTGRLGDPDDLQTATAAARAAPPGPLPPRPTDLLLTGVATRIAAGHAAGLGPLAQALESFRSEAAAGGESEMSWMWLACPVAPEPIAPDLWDDEAWHLLATRAVQLARTAGALSILPFAMGYQAGVSVHSGELAAAAALLDEAASIAAATDAVPPPYTSLLLLAHQGDELTARRAIDSAVHQATTRGDGRALGLAGYAAAVLHNGLGHYDTALESARSACEYEDLGFYGSALAELVEAAVRCGARSEAETAHRELDERARSSGTGWAQGVLARSQALLSEGQDADRLYRQSIEHLSGSRAAVQLARTYLTYGEWLRRENRRTQSRDQLRGAYDRFSRMGAQAFADRARRELQATGEKAPRRAEPADSGLTAQESRIAHLAGDGLTNREIGAQLFLSPHTVEWHLRKVFTKTGVSSRRQLGPALRSGG